MNKREKRPRILGIAGLHSKNAASSIFKTLTPSFEAQVNEFVEEAVKVVPGENTRAFMLRILAKQWEGVEDYSELTKSIPEHLRKPQYRTIPSRALGITFSDGFVVYFNHDNSVLN